MPISSRPLQEGGILAHSVMYSLKVVDHGKAESHFKYRMLCFNSQNLDEVLTTTILMRSVICPVNDVLQNNTHHNWEYCIC